MLNGVLYFDFWETNTKNLNYERLRERAQMRRRAQMEERRRQNSRRRSKALYADPTRRTIWGICLPEVGHAALEQGHELLTGDVLVQAVAAALHMAHLAEHAAVGGGDALDAGDGAVEMCIRDRCSSTPTSRLPSPSWTRSWPRTAPTKVCRLYL